MKHVAAPSATLIGLSLVMGCLVSSCELLNLSPGCPEPKYYPFTEADKQWQQFMPDAQWVFENQRHQQRTYRIGRVRNEVKKPNWVSGSQTEYLDYYLDYWYMTIERTDSTSRAGSFMIKRIPVYQHYDRSRLDAQFYWPGYVGQHNDMGGTFSDYLEFGDDLTTNTFHNLTVRGVNYLRVNSFQASSIAISRLAGYNIQEKTIALDYDQEAGIIRFVTSNGNVWERIP